MTTGKRRTLALVAGLVAALTATPTAALAYGGPGSVVTGIGALLAAVAAIGAALFGFFWFPVKRLIQKLRGDEEPVEEEDETGTGVAEAS